MASITKRPGIGGKPAYRAEIRRKGFPKQIKTFALKRDADKWATKIEREMDAGTWRDLKDAHKIILKDMLEKYLKTVSIKKRPGTCCRDKLSSSYLEKNLGYLSLAQVTPSRLAKYRDDRLKDASANSVRIELALLSNLFNIAKREWRIGNIENPVKQITKPEIPESRCPILSKEQVKRLLHECKKSGSKFLYSFVLLALHTGCRSKELRALRWTQVNLIAGTITLIASETKGKKTRIVPLTEPAKNILQNLADKANKEIGTDENGVPIGVIFPATNDPHKPRDMHKHFDLAVIKAGLNKLPDAGKLRIHDLRHVCGTFLLMNGADLETVREILGHRDLSTTQKYLHVVNAHKKKAIDKISYLGLSDE